MDQPLLFNGIFNTLILGIPVWLWTGLLLIIICLFTNAYWWFMFWSPLKPLHGIWRASWTNTDAALLCNKDNNLKLVSEQRSKVIFNESVIEAKAAEHDWKDITSGQIGVIGLDIILDLNKWTDINSEEHKVIEEAADLWNIDNPDDQVHSMYKFTKYVEEGKIKIDIPTTTTVSWVRIESAFPKTRNTSIYAGYIRQLAEKLDKEEKTKYDNYVIYILVGSVLISALFILGKFFLHKPI